MHYRLMFMTERIMPLCLTVSWVYIVAILCVWQVCVHNRTRDAAVSDSYLGAHCCYSLCVAGLCS